MTKTVQSFFVYGTLKRGQQRESMWPSTPTSVRAGMVKGALFGREDYPALTAGDDWVRGELWTFATNQLPSVICTLDKIEGTNQPGAPDLYRRSVQSIFDSAHDPIAFAYTYFYVRDPVQDGFVRVVPGDDGQACWPTNE